VASLSAVIDSNVYVYRAIEDSVHHERSKELLNTLSRWVTPTLVVHEVVWTLSELVGRQAALLYVKALLAHSKVEVVPVTKQDISWALEAVVDEDLSLARYNDKAVLSVARRTGLPLLSFDKKLLSQASRAGVATINPYSAPP